MELQIWQSDWGLPSIDVNCLEALAYAAFAGAPLRRVKNNNPFLSPKGEYPLLKDESGTILSGTENITTYLRKKNFNADYSLNKRQCSEVSAYIHFVREKLFPALQYVWWIDTKNYIEFVRPYYARAIQLPFNFYYPGRFEEKARELISAIYGDELDDSTLETAVHKSAEECLNHLSTRLGEKDFFYGSTPCYLDAVVFAHLAPLLKAPLPSSSLQNHLKACPNLTKFVARVLNRYFLKDLQEYEDKKKEEAASHTDGDSFPNQRRHIILSVIAGVVAMGAYAVHMGMIQFGSGQSDDEYDEELDEEEEEE